MNPFWMNWKLMAFAFYENRWLGLPSEPQVEVPRQHPVSISVIMPLILFDGHLAVTNPLCGTPSELKQVPFGGHICSWTNPANPVQVQNVFLGQFLQHMALYNRQYHTKFSFPGKQLSHT